MKSSKWYRKQGMSWLIVIALILGLVPASMSSAAKKVSLSSKKMTITVGKSKKLKLKNNKKKVKWKVVSGKKNVKLKAKKKTGVTIVAKKKGKAKVQAKVGKKKYTCKVTVASKKKAPSPEEPEAPNDDGNGSDSNTGTSDDPYGTTTPGGTTNPGNTMNPADPTNPTGSNAPAPSGGGVPTASTIPSGNPTLAPGVTGLPAASVNPSQSQKPGESASPQVSQKPGESSNPAESQKPGESANPAESQNPSESSNPSATPGASSSAAPTASATANASAMPTASAKVSATPTATAKASATPTASAKASATPAASAKASATPAASAKASTAPTASAKASATPTPKASATPTASAKATATPTPTPSSSSGGLAGKTIFTVAGKQLALGLTRAEVISLMGNPSREEPTPQGYTAMVYNPSKDGYTLIYLDSGVVVSICAVGSTGKASYGSMVTTGDSASTLTTAKGWSGVSTFAAKDGESKEGEGAYARTDSNSNATVLAYVDYFKNNQVYCIQAYSNTVASQILDTASCTYSNTAVLTAMKTQTAEFLIAYRLASGYSASTYPLKSVNGLSTAAQNYLDSCAKGSDKPPAIQNSTALKSAVLAQNGNDVPVYFGQITMSMNADSIGFANSALEQKGGSEYIISLSYLGYTSAGKPYKYWYQYLGIGAYGGNGKSYMVIDLVDRWYDSDAEWY